MKGPTAQESMRGIRGVLDDAMADDPETALDAFDALDAILAIVAQYEQSQRAAERGKDAE